MKLVAFLFLTIAVAKAELEFTAFFITSKESFYMLTDKESRVGSGWLKVGQSFAGYTIAAFESEYDVLVLKKAGHSLRLPIREAKVKDGRSMLTGTVELGPDATVAGIRATLFLDEEMAFPVKAGVTLFLKAERRSDGNLSYRARFEVTKSDGVHDRIDFPEMGARPGQPFRIQSGDYGFGFIPERPNLK